MIQDHPDLLNEGQKIYRLFETLCERAMKSKNTNEVMGLKFHYLGHIVKAAVKNKDDMDAFVKK